MAIAVKLQDPAGTLYDLTTGQHGFITVGLPDQSKQLEADFAEITAGDQAVTFRNDDAWFDSQWVLPLDPEQRYDESTGLGCWTLILYKGGAISWVGDLDVRSVEFDPKAKTVSATFLGKAKRLEYRNASKVRRAIPQNTDSGTGTGGTNTFTGTVVGAWAANAFVNHVLVDNAGNAFVISASTKNASYPSAGGNVTFTVVGNPATGAYNVRPFGLIWKAATGGGYSHRILTSKVAISTLQLVPGDVIKITKLKSNGKILQQELEIQDTNATDGTLSIYELRFKRRLKGQYDYTCGTSCTTPYYRNLSPATLVGYIFDWCGITAGNRQITITSFPTTNLVPYFDTDGKNCAEALTELAVICGATWFATPTKYYFISLDQTKTGNTPKTIDSLVMEEKWSGLWEKFYNYITAKGTKDGQYARKGGLTYPENKLELSTDYVDNITWLQQIVDRAYSSWGVRRKPGTLTLKDDGTVYEIWDEVIRSGVSYMVIGSTEPMRSVDATTRSTVDITVIAKSGTAATTGVGESQDEAIDTSDPPPPDTLELNKVDGTEPALFRTLYPAVDYPKMRKSAPQWVSSNPPVYAIWNRRLYCFRFKWPYDDLQGRLLGFHLKKWRDGGNPDKPIGEGTWRDPVIQSDGYYYWPPEADGDGGPTYIRAGKKAWITVQAVYEDGRMSAFADEVFSAVETETDEELPTAATFTSVTSYVDDVKGTTKIECSADVVVGLTGSTPKEKVRVYVTDTTTGKKFTATATVAFADTTATLNFRKCFIKADSCHVDSIEVINGGKSVWTTLTAPTGNFTAGGTPLTVVVSPSATSCVPGGTIQFTVTPGGGTGPYALDFDYGDGSSHYSGSSASTFDATHGTPVLGLHTYATAGTYNAIALITDANGSNVASIPVSILVTAAPGIGGVPVPVLTASATHGAPTLASVLTIAASGGTGPYQYDVNFGDGTSHATGSGWNGASTALASHNYTTTGTFTAVLKVTDAGGVSAEISLAIYVGVDVAPTGVSCTAVSWEDDIPGTPGKECDLEVTVSWTGDATSIEVQVDETRNSATRTHTKRKAFPLATSTSAKVIWRQHFKRGTAVVIRAYAKKGTAISTVSADVNHTVGTALPSVPAFNGLTVKQAKKQHTIFLPTWATAAGASEAYRQIEIEAPTLFDNGTSSSVGANTLTDSSKSWTVGALVGMLLVTSAGVSYAITANTATQLTVSAGGATPASGAYTVSRWDLAKTHNIKAVRNSGTCSLRVEHSGDYQQAQIRLRMMDSYDQYSSYYPTDATRGDVGTDLTWWSSPNPPGDGDNPMSSWPWIFNGATAFWDNTGKRVQVGNNGIAMLDVPLQKQAVKVSGNFGVSSWSYSAQFAIIDPITGNGYAVSVGSTSAVLSKVVAWSPSTLQTVTYAALASDDLEASLEIHKNKVAMVIGNGQYRKEATDTTYRIKGWKLYSIMGATAGGNYMYISALSVKNGASYYDGVTSSTLMAVTDANGFLSADSTKVTIGGTAQALSPMFTKVGAGIYFDGNYVRERDPVALASLPTTDLKAGMMLPVYDSGGSGAGKCKIAMYIPANFFGGSWPASDTWFYTGMTSTTAGSTGNTGTGGTGGTGGTCFTGDMEVLTPDGPRKLEELQVGDLIVSIDQETGEQVEDRVAAIGTHMADAHLLLDDFLAVTEEHYLFGWDRGRVPASCPQHAAGVFPLGGLMWEYGLPPRARALSTKTVVNEPAPVYSLTTGTKCYWVGKGGTYVLAHNLKNLDI